MQLRNLQSWPPYWVGSFSECGRPKYLRSGILRGAELIAGLPSTLIIHAEHAGGIQTGLIDLDDSSYRDPLYRNLKENIGKPLNKIGHLEIVV